MANKADMADSKFLHSALGHSLPTIATTATSLAFFKKQLKTFLFTKSFLEL